MTRDFTYIDDVVEAIIRVIDTTPEHLEERYSDDDLEMVQHQIYNVGYGSQIELLDFISTIEGCLGRKAIINFLPMQKGDMCATEADVSKLKSDFGYHPRVKLEEGIATFIEWYLKYYKVET